MLKYALLALLVSGPLLAQIPANVKVCDPSTPARCAKVDTSGNMQVTGTFTSAGAGDTVGASASLGALNDRVSVAGAGQGGCGVHVGAGLTGTLTPEISIDNGTTWIATKFIDTAGTTTSTQVLAGGGLDIGIVVLGGQRKCSVRVSAYTSGSATAFTVATTSTSAGASGGGGGAVTQSTSPWIVAGGGTAGTAATGVVTIQGIAAMTKLLVTPDSVALPANQSTNVAQVGGTATDTNSGAKSAGTMRVVLATDQPALTNKLLVTPDSVALPANQSVNVNQVAGTATDTNSGLKSAGTMRVVLATDQPALTNKLLVTPDSVALPANQSVNVNQLAGTTTDTNSGVKSAGTLRVVLATDQPALTNKLLVTPDSVALPANQSVNVAQMAGTTTDTNSGVKSAGTLRVVLATDQPALTNKLLVTPDANSAINVAQIGGNATLAGNGVTGTGSQRVTVASDNTPFTVTAQGAAAEDAVLSGNPVPIGMKAAADAAAPSVVSAAGDIVIPKASLEGRQLVMTDHPNRFHCSSGLTTATALTECQAAPGAGVSLYITDITMSSNIVATATTDQQLIIKSGTGSNCATGTAIVFACFNPATGGCAKSFTTPIKIAANTAICWMDAVVGSKYFMVEGFKAP